MNRRATLIALSGMLGLLLDAARGRAADRHRVAFLSPLGFAPGSSSGVMATGITERLTKDGYREGGALDVVKLGAGGHPADLPGLVAELVARKPDVIVTFGYPAAEAAKAGTSVVPIIVINAGDPVRTHLVQSLSHPGGNLTGISDVAGELAPKRLQLLKEMAPSLKRVAMLWNANDLGMTMRYEASAEAAERLGVTVVSLGVREPDDFADAFAAMDRHTPDGLLMVADTLTMLNRKRVFDYAATHRLPAIYEGGAFAHDGGLMSYGPDQNEMQASAAGLIERILSGASPADLPLEQPTRFRLAINLKTAEALGLAVPPLLLAQADEVIQ
jgi:putative ABC transport system substrate-binding protein